MRNLLAICLGFTLLQACTAQVGGRTFEKGDRLAARPGYSRIYVLNRSDSPSAADATVELDGKFIGQTPANGSLHFEVVPGKHLVAAGSPTSAPMKLNTKPGETVFVRLYTPSARGVQPILQIVSTAEGAASVRE